MINPYNLCCETSLVAKHGKFFGVLAGAINGDAGRSFVKKIVFRLDIYLWGLNELFLYELCSKFR